MFAQQFNQHPSWPGCCRAVDRPGRTDPRLITFCVRPLILLPNSRQGGTPLSWKRFHYDASRIEAIANESALPLDRLGVA
jgi:hypothetical protein